MPNAAERLLHGSKHSDIVMVKDGGAGRWVIKGSGTRQLLPAGSWVGKDQLGPQPRWHITYITLAEQAAQVKDR